MADEESVTKMAKQQLRKQMSNIIEQLGHHDRLRQSEHVVNQVLSHHAYQKAQRLSIFLSMPTEIRTEAIIKDAFEQNKQIFAPRFVKASNHMDMVKIMNFEDFESLPEIIWGIKQPKLDDERENALDLGLDLVIVPGVAFTLDGGRLGQGRGYYDRFLTSYGQKFGKIPKTIALAFKEQILDSVPLTETDVPIDFIVH